MAEPGVGGAPRNPVRDAVWAPNSNEHVGRIRSVWRARNAPLERSCLAAANPFNKRLESELS